ncbi:MAG: hypothetical protein H6674_09075 [Dehalococcoidia bacterium]|nr:hypothetical protein [Dehalococcoidia bacterium]
MGVIYAKDLLAYVQNGNVTPHLADIARPPYVVPETKRANELLADLRRDQVHMAIAVDEYGGTAGVITVEDLVEEIVGAIEDEYDKAVVDVTQISETEAIVDASLTIDELNRAVRDADPLRGLRHDRRPHRHRARPPRGPRRRGRRPRPDDLEEDEVAVRLRVMSILGRRIKKVNVQRYEPSAEGSPSAPPGRRRGRSVLGCSPPSSARSQEAAIAARRSRVRLSGTLPRSHR